MEVVGRASVGGLVGESMSHTGIPCGPCRVSGIKGMTIE